MRPLVLSATHIFDSDDRLALTPLDVGDTHETCKQLVKPKYVPNGAFYGIRTAVLREQKTVFPKRLRGLVMKQVPSIDIDDQEDGGGQASGV